MAASPIPRNAAATLSWRAPLLVLAFLLSFAPAATLLRWVVDSLAHWTTGATVVLGIAAGIALAIALRDRLEFANTYGHEHAHMIAALTLLRPVTELRASSESGGHLSFLGESSLWIAAAPYTFPLLALGAAALASVPHGPVGQTACRAAIGFFLGYHLAVAGQHLRRNFAPAASSRGGVGDFAIFGRIWTCLYVWSLNVAVVGTLVSFAAAGPQGARRFWRDSGRAVVRQASALGDELLRATDRNRQR